MNSKTKFLLSIIVTLLFTSLPFLKANQNLNNNNNNKIFENNQNTSNINFSPSNFKKLPQSETKNTSNNSFKDIEFKILKRMLMSKCNVENCNPAAGVCKGEKCVCLEGYLTVPIKGDSHSCNYQQKKIIYALLLESFGLFGFGHIYAGRFFNGFLKLVWFFVNIFYGVQFVMVLMKENSDTDAAYYVKMIISFACISVPILWHFIDLYKFSNNLYLDGNEIPMLNW